MQLKTELTYMFPAGTYECGFTRGSLTHKAKTRMRVALLPDVITMKIDPLTADCSKKLESASIDVDVTATILNSSESFQVWWSYMDERKGDLSNRSKNNLQCLSLPSVLVTSVFQLQRIH